MLSFGFFLILVFSGLCTAQNDGTKPILTPFEENKAGIYQWIATLLSQYGVGGEAAPPPPVPIDQSKCQPCGCGLANSKNRIVGGQETKVKEYTWMCLLTYRGVFYCGCTLINNKYVLTAGHCVHGIYQRRYDVERKKGAGRPLIDIDEVLQEAVESRPSTSARELARECVKSFAGETGIVTGWGVKSPSKYRGSISPVLQELKVPIMTNDECRESGYERSQITENMLCAGYKEGGKDSCQGDSGGPLVVKEEDYHMIVGVVSWGQGCARPNFPGVYCRVNRYLPWILKYTADACQCSRIPRQESSDEDGPKVISVTTVNNLTDEDWGTRVEQ
nr:trypsin-1 [Halyomorpha halys]